MNDKIKEAIESVRPYIQADGGDIEFIKYEDNYVYVKLSGKCIGCPMQKVTLENTITQILQETIPEIQGVINEDL